MTGRFITLEGGEGAGKTTQIRLLVETLKGRGISVVTTREPGGSPGAEEIRGLLVNGAPGRWDALTETLLIYAARADHVKRTIGPALLRNDWVISDRFADSTYAYQGAGRGLAREIIRRIDSLVLDDFRPDLTLILDLDVDTGLARAGARGGTEQRFESFDREFHQKLRQAFLDIARRDPGRCVVVDAGQDKAKVRAAIWAAVTERLGL
jgi:dTMP kinase